MEADVDDDPETALRKANERATKESLDALRRQSRGQYNRHTCQKTVADIQESDSEKSDESEEDPDDDETTTQHLCASKARNASGPSPQFDGSASFSQTQGTTQDEGNEAQPVHSLTPDDYGTQIVESLADMSSSSGNAVLGMNAQSSEKSCRPQAYQDPTCTTDTLIKKRTLKPNERIRIYIVKKALNDDKPQLLGEIFSDRSEANKFAKSKVQAYRNGRNKPASLTEDYDEDGLYRGMVRHSIGGTTTIYVSSQIKRAADLDDDSQIQPRLTEQSYLVICTIKTTVVDPATKTATATTTSAPLEGMHFSDREYANNEAAKYLMSFMRPKRPNLDDVQQFENELCPQIRDACKIFDGGKDCFKVELEKGDGAPRWMEEDVVGIEVKLFSMTGPLN